MEMQVRDYECDVQGVVNNATYFNYLEQARNQIFRENGMSSLFELHKQNEDPIIVRAEIDYRYPLWAYDVFVIHTQIETKGSFRLLFRQKIIAAEEQNARRIADALFIVAVLREGRPAKIDSTETGHIVAMAIENT